MLIKSVTTKGDAVSFTPAEALIHAVKIGLSSKNGSNFIYWSNDKAVPTSKFVVQNVDNENNYEAFAEGVVNAGKTSVSSDMFFAPTAHHFSIHYKSAKDDMGLPHLQVVSFSLNKVNTNPAENVGPIPELQTRESLMTSVGEIVPSSGGKPRGKSTK